MNVRKSLAQRSATSARVLALPWLLAANLVAAADEEASPAPATPLPALLAQAGLERAPETPREAHAPQSRFRTAAVMATTAGGTLAYGRSKWWQDGFTGSFRTVDEGWFGANTDHGGADKLGHTGFAYASTRLLTRAYEWAGNDARSALKLGLWTSVGTLMAVEVIDGYSKKWRFSREDALANLAGGALGYVMESYPELDALIDLRLQYSPSQGPTGRRGFDPFGDYSGQRYLVVLKVSGVPALRERPWLRYLELNVGYGTRNFEPESRTQVTPTRHVYFGVSLNLSEVLRSTVYKNNTTPSRTQRFTESFFEYVQLPAAGVRRDHVIR